MTLFVDITMQNMEEIALEIKQQMNLKGVSQRELSNKLSKNYTYINRLINLKSQKRLMLELLHALKTDDYGSFNVKIDISSDDFKEI